MWSKMKKRKVLASHSTHLILKEKRSALRGEHISAGDPVTKVDAGTEGTEVGRLVTKATDYISITKNLEPERVASSLREAKEEGVWVKVTPKRAFSCRTSGG